MPLPFPALRPLLRSRSVRLRHSARHLARLGFVVSVVVGVVQPGSLSAVGADAAAVAGRAGIVPAPGIGIDVGGGLATAGGPGADPTAVTAMQQVIAQLDPAAAVGQPLEQLDATVSELDRHMAVVGAQIESARGHLAVVEVDRSRLDAAIVDTQARIDALRAQVAEEAISIYVSPRNDALEVFTGSSDLDSSVRRQGLLRSLVETGDRAADELRIARQDLLELRAALDGVAGGAALLRADVDATQAQLDGAAARRAEVAATLAARVEALDAEIVGQQRSEAKLVRVLSAAELEAEEQASRRLSSPIDAPITSEFGTRWGRMHNGVDFESDIGVPIYAAKSGVVIEADWLDGYGQVTVIDHGGGLTTLYAHQSAFEVGAGERVERGQLIGYVGVTGNSTGPHLHFETREHGVATDPRKYLS